MIKLHSDSLVAVVGLGRVGQIISRYLLKKGTLVYAYEDNKNVLEKKEIKDLILNPKFVIVKTNQWSTKNKKPTFAVSSPGFSQQNKTIKYLKSNNIPIIDEIAITASEVGKNIIAITGTNGKSTTTALLGKILQNDGKNIFWGGNLAPGLPFATTLFQEPKDYYVIETSSFQLERSDRFHPKVAILLNITPDHLDRHDSLAEYQTIKFKIFANQNKSDYAVINYEDKVIMDHKKLIKSKINYFSDKRKVKGTYTSNNNIFFYDRRICSLNNINLLGTHFINSILSAVCAAKIIGVKNNAIVETLRNFNGLEHRLEFVAEYDGVKFINNSMCTNPAAGVATLKSFKKPVILIAGGKEKNLEIDDYIKIITVKTKQVILIGQNRYGLAKKFDTYKFNDYNIADSLKDAVMKAKKCANPGDIVLFSPGFASYDTFSNFQERGSTFKEIVYGIK